MEIYKHLPDSYDPLCVEQPTEGVYNYQDPACHFLRLKVTPKNRIWVFDKGHAGKHVKRRIGDATRMGVIEARLRAMDWCNGLDEGRLPPTQEDKRDRNRKLSQTVTFMFDYYYHHHALLRCSTHEEILASFRRYWRPIAGMNIASLTPQNVRKWFNDLAKQRGKATANKQLTLFKSAMRFGIESDVITFLSDPTLGIRPFPELKRTEYLKKDEVDRLAESLAKEPKVIQDVIWMLLLTGQRKSNVTQMRWSEIDFDHKLWTIPPDKTKTSRQYSIALTPKAMEILSSRPMTSDLVFEYVDIDRAWRRVRDRAGLNHLVIHDLRHTAGTWLAMEGASAMQIQQALQHSNISASARYVHLAANNVRDIMAKSQERCGTK